jgi:transcription elongation factor SPT6
VIVVATGSRDSQSVLEDIKLSMRELEQENQMAPINVELVDHEVAEIFEKSSRSEVQYLLAVVYENRIDLYIY